jgi:hypothetical protein
MLPVTVEFVAKLFFSMKNDPLLQTLLHDKGLRKFISPPFCGYILLLRVTRNEIS